MRFNDLLVLAGIAPTDVAVMLHTPVLPAMRRALLALVEDEPALFEAYQDNHPHNAEATLKGRRFAASFVVGERGESRFVGLYTVEGWTFRTAAELDIEPARQALMIRFHDATFTSLAPGQVGGRAVFDLRRLPALADLRGRLVVPRPVGRAYMRLAENCDLPVLEIAREARFAPLAPAWDDFIVTAFEVRALPSGWQGRLREWRGVYLIVDERDGGRYVGAAYGAENLLGRWQAHVAGDAGVTVELAQRDPASFRFSILELVAPTAPPDLVIAAEQNWKTRLHTVAHGLNRN